MKHFGIRSRVGEMMSKLLDKVKLAFDTGFFHIMICNVVNNGFAFIAGVLLVRIVPKSQYGIYAYANNILSYFLLFSGFGMTSRSEEHTSELQSP